MVAATSDASCFSLEAFADVSVPAALSGVAACCSVVEMKEAISCTELFVGFALFNAVTCAEVMAAI